MKHGVVEETQIEYVKEGNNNNILSDVTPGWACYSKKQSIRPLVLSIVELLHSLFLRGNVDKSRRISANCVHILVMYDVAGRNWYEYTVLTETRIKVFFGVTREKHVKLLTALRNENVDAAPNNDVYEVLERAADLEKVHMQLNKLENLR